jgi:hypothetical protein
MNPHYHWRTRQGAEGTARRASAPLCGPLVPCWRTSEGHRATLVAGGH